MLTLVLPDVPPDVLTDVLPEVLTDVLPLPELVDVVLPAPVPVLPVELPEPVLTLTEALPEPVPALPDTETFVVPPPVEAFAVTPR